VRAYTFEEYIDRSPRVVWDTLVNLDVASKWRPLVQSMSTEDGQPVHAGSKVRLVIDFLGRRQTRVSTTVAFDPEKRWALHSSERPEMEGVYEFGLRPDGTGTRIVATCDLTSHGFMPWLFLRLIARGERERRRDMLGNLKRYVEQTFPK
jgi:carbon monoxide dehydrogenase subunit G